MKDAAEIERLVQRYEFYMRLGKRKAAANIYVKLVALRLRQLRREMKQSRKQAA